MFDIGGDKIEMKNINNIIKDSTSEYVIVYDDTTDALEFANIPIWAVHGAKDPVVPVEGSRDMAAALKVAGAGDFHYTELPEVEHDAWNYTFGNAEIFRWLFSHRKEK